MTLQSIFPTRRRWLKRVSWSVFLCLVLVGGALTFWQQRLNLTSRLLRNVLDQQGLADLEFKLSRFSPSGVVVEKIRWGHAAETALLVDWVEIRFSWQDVFQGRIERLRARGIRTDMTMENGRLSALLLQRLQTLATRQARPSAVATSRAEQAWGLDSFGEVSLYDLQVVLRFKECAELVTLRGDVSLIAEADGGGSAASARASRYRLWSSWADTTGTQINIAGTIVPKQGLVEIKPEITLQQLGPWLARARSFTTAATNWAEMVVPLSGSLSIRGACKLEHWSELTDFNLTAELGRGNKFSFPQKKALMRFQTLRVEASGSLSAPVFKFSGGIAELSLGETIQLTQEAGRLLSLRGAGQFKQSPQGMSLALTCDADLPGKFIAQVLPKVLPLFPVFFSNGGTLRTEADLKCDLADKWQGEVRFKAGAVRSAAPLAVGRVGAGAVDLTATLKITNAVLEEASLQVALSDGYWSRPELSVRGDAALSLTTHAPFAVAQGVFSGKLRAPVFLKQPYLSVAREGIPFAGEVAMQALFTKPVWEVDLNVPDFNLRAELAEVQAQALMGLMLKARYDQESLALAGEAWAREITINQPGERASGNAAGVERFNLAFKVPEFKLAAATNAEVSANIKVDNGWFNLGTAAVMSQAQVELPLTWSAVEGLKCMPGPILRWQKFSAHGLNIEPGRFAVNMDAQAATVRLGIHLQESQLGCEFMAVVPWDDPMKMSLTCAVPEVVLTAEDAVLRRVREQVPGVVLTGRCRGEAELRFLGRKPYVVGQFQVWDGVARGEKFNIEGLALTLPFEGIDSFRTIKQPRLTFNRAKISNVQMDQGSLIFQVTSEHFFVDRLEVGWCRGQLNAYSIHLNFKNPDVDFIVYADRVDLGQALMMFLPFQGMVEGVLYGRIPVGIKEGRLKLSTGFLYSLPGQGGRLVLDDSRQMAELLEKAGLRGEVQEPLAKALSNMDFTAFKMDLEQRNASDYALRFKVKGASNFKDWPAPVDLNLNLYGPIEELLNMGLDMSRK